MNSSSWLLRRKSAQHNLRLYCFSYAGGSATNFMPWQALVEPNIEICAVQLPGRGVRMNEAPFQVLPDLVQTLAQVIAQNHEYPFAFFGHSLGGLLAFEVARYSMRHNLPMPLHLFVSGANAPQFRQTSKNLHLLPDNELIQSLREYNGTPAEILEQRELMELILPTIRADFALVENYKYQSSSPLEIPITVLAGRDDSHTQVERLMGWERETIKPCSMKWFDGDHFFINTQQKNILDCLRNELSIVEPEFETLV